MPRTANPFVDSANDLAIVSLDTLRQERMQEYLFEAPPYDLVVFDEAHKLSARYERDRTVTKSKRYQLAERIAADGKSLLLLTATPHMGKNDAYYFSVVEAADARTARRTNRVSSVARRGKVETSASAHEGGDDHLRRKTNLSAAPESDHCLSTQAGGRLANNRYTMRSQRIVRTILTSPDSTTKPRRG